MDMTETCATRIFHVIKTNWNGNTNFLNNVKFISTYGNPRYSFLSYREEIIKSCWSSQRKADHTYRRLLQPKMSVTFYESFSSEPKNASQMNFPEENF